MSTVEVMSPSVAPRASGRGTDMPSDAPNVTQEPGPDAPALCSRRGDDAVRRLFCGSTPPVIGSLAELSAALQVMPLTLLGHSTAFGGQHVSEINPRAISIAAGAQMLTLLAFARGDQRAEIVSYDAANERFNFYLLEYRQDCNDSDAGCVPGDLYTPEVERGWRKLTLRDDEELKNTPQDCRRCHQRGARTPLEKPMLLMRELNPPWTHFFETASSDRSDLRDAYRMAKREEPYAGFDEDVILGKGSGQGPSQLESAIEIARNGGAQPAQPIDFPSGSIADEFTTTGASRTWRQMYETFRLGEAVAPPYYKFVATDPEKVAARSSAYQKYQHGELPQHEVPDLGDVFPDDQQTRAEIGLAVEPDASGPVLSVQACEACHNALLDPTLSRARFDIDLPRMSRAELDLAIERLALPEDDPQAMPPREARKLDPAGRARLSAYLHDFPTTH